MSLELADRVVMVTGAGSGIGRAAARLLAGHGARVVLVGRTPGALAETAAGLPPSHHLVAPCDVADDQQVERCVAEAVARFGRLDGAFNNAGTFGAFGPLHQDTPGNFDAVVATNLRGVWACTRAQVRAMLAGGGGAIVNCSSVAGHIGHAQSPVYAATKHAVIGLSKSAALQYAGDGVRVNVVSPGSTDTPMLRGLYADPGALDQRARRAPLGRLGTCEEVANAAVWLLSPLSGYVTGQTVVVDGGVTAGSAAVRPDPARDVRHRP
ncbi:SDR family oxidoreductase [Streptomyces sp. B1866]|uniref:SDR family NAD(P)-dependent oxidoreductase n=1 Tax=Streptomyces sp. B1866 TaxID=3075431 RepID=UPI00288E6434|nr:SDR family oxidoreductase [Streptomyces sp. B1866]MDT3396932.1 SDR family oxidoreductase [Streptomyces sp. B1866]